MPRQNLLRGRISLPHQIYHVTTCTLNRQPLFKNFRVARIAINEIRSIQESQLANTYAWVLMPDHLHWLLKLPSDVALSQLIKIFKARSSKRINQYLNRSGSLWQKGFYDHAIRKDEDIKSVARYIIANPLRARLVNTVGDYPHWDAQWIIEQHEELVK